jgi:predicted HAD superfamily phosphohydrolase YqeG
MCLPDTCAIISDAKKKRNAVGTLSNTMKRRVSSVSGLGVTNVSTAMRPRVAEVRSMA